MYLLLARRKMALTVRATAPTLCACHFPNNSIGIKRIYKRGSAAAGTFGIEELWMTASSNWRCLRPGPRAIAAIALTLLTLPSHGGERVPIPSACREVADRGGLPQTLTPGQAKRAIAYLAIMSSQDPAVTRCRRALPQ